MVLLRAEALLGPFVGAEGRQGWGRCQNTVGQGCPGFSAPGSVGP